MLTKALFRNVLVIVFHLAVCTIGAELSAQIWTPYGAAPSGDVCVTGATLNPEPNVCWAPGQMMLGAPTLRTALEKDQKINPKLNGPVTYAVGSSGVAPNVSGGGHEANGYCYHLQVVKSTSCPSCKPPSIANIIMQSINTGLPENSFDLYVPNGGAGAFPGDCGWIWGGESSIGWKGHLENSVACRNQDAVGDTAKAKAYCQGLFGKLSPQIAGWKDIILSACEYSLTTNLGCANWGARWAQVQCPVNLTYVTGLMLASNPGKTIDLTAPPDSSYWVGTVGMDRGNGITQMMDCRTPDSGDCGNVQGQTVADYKASISVDQGGNPILNPHHLGCMATANGQPISYPDNPPTGRQCPSVWPTDVTPIGCCRYLGQVECNSILSSGKYCNSSANCLSNCNGVNFVEPLSQTSPTGDPFSCSATWKE